MHPNIEYLTKIKVLMAPLSGVTDLAYRLICRKYGCRFAFTEMTDAGAVVYAAHKTRLINTTAEDQPLAVQLSGNDPKLFLKAAQHCETKGMAFIDINAACPMPKVIRRHKGSSLLNDPILIAKIIETLVKGVSIPITIKIRSGFDEQHHNCVEIARIAQEQGASAVFFHPRLAEQRYAGNIIESDIDALKSVLKIPLFVSGNLFTPEAALKRLKESGCAGVVIARGCLGAPWIFSQIHSLLEGKECPLKNKVQELSFRINVAKEHFALFSEFAPLHVAIPRMYKHVAWYLKRPEHKDDLMRAYHQKVKSKQDFYAFMDGIEVI